MPALVDEATFDKVQKMLELNKRNASQRKAGKLEDAPRYWLTGKLFCGECGSSMQGVSGTSKTGAKYYYYYCKEQRSKRCHKKSVRKEWLEDLVTGILKGLLDDSENLASIAIDAAAYYKNNYKDTKYLEGLGAQRKEAEKGIANFIKAIEIGIINEATQQRMAELEEQKNALTEAIEAENNIRQSLYEDEHSIKAYFDKYLHADFDNPDTRDMILEYFVDKIHLYNDKIVITSWFSEDNREVPFEVLNGDNDLLLKGKLLSSTASPLAPH